MANQPTYILWMTTGPDGHAIPKPGMPRIVRHDSFDENTDPGSLCLATGVATFLFNYRPQDDLKFLHRFFRTTEEAPIQVIFKMAGEQVVIRRSEKEVVCVAGMTTLVCQIQPSGEWKNCGAMVVVSSPTAAHRREECFVDANVCERLGRKMAHAMILKKKWQDPDALVEVGFTLAQHLAKWWRLNIKREKILADLAALPVPTCTRGKPTQRRRAVSLPCGGAARRRHTIDIAPPAPENAVQDDAVEADAPERDRLRIEEDVAKDSESRVNRDSPSLKGKGVDRTEYRDHGLQYKKNDVEVNGSSEEGGVSTNTVNGEGNGVDWSQTRPLHHQPKKDEVNENGVEDNKPHTKGGVAEKGDVKGKGLEKGVEADDVKENGDKTNGDDDDKKKNGGGGRKKKAVEDN